MDFLHKRAKDPSLAALTPLPDEQSGLGDAPDQAKDGRAAAVQFQSILDHRGEVPASPLYAFAHLGLARAATLIDDIARARKEYDEMLGLWKDADANLQTLKEARLERARLKPTS